MVLQLQPAHVPRTVITHQVQLKVKNPVPSRCGETRRRRSHLSPLSVCSLNMHCTYCRVLYRIFLANFVRSVAFGPTSSNCSAIARGSTRQPPPTLSQAPARLRAAELRLTSADSVSFILLPHNYVVMRTGTGMLMRACLLCAVWWPQRMLFIGLHQPPTQPRAIEPVPEPRQLHILQYSVLIATSWNACLCMRV